jgi:hypothetical protein
MTDREKQRPPRVPEFISAHSEVGHAEALRRWSVATLLAQSRTPAEEAAPERAHRHYHAQLGEQ